MKGYFITFEGGEGSGKTTVINQMYEGLRHEGRDVILTREPGGIPISEGIRNIILDPNHKAMEARTEALLYAAARRQHLIEKIMPALAEGKIVICDRFIDSSLTYQGHARGVGMEEILSINQFAIDDCMPSLTLFFDILPEKGLERITRNESREKNRLDMEELEFHQRVYEGYHILLEKYPERIKRIDADQTIDEVTESALKYILKHIS